MSRSTATVRRRSPRSRSVDAGNGRARSSGGRMTRSAPGSRRTALCSSPLSTSTGRNPARDRAAVVARGALRVRAAGRARCGAVAAVLPFEDAQGRGTRNRSARGPLGVLRAEPRRARRDCRVRVRSEAGKARRQLRSGVLQLGDFLRRAEHMGGDEIKQTVKEKYGQAALRVAGGERGSCGGTGRCGCDPVSSNLYDAAETATLPEGAVLASLGCGNPTALAELHEGEVVLDLGSGGGIDVLLSAKRVGRTGKAYGLDMTDEMLGLARENQRKAGVTNVEFLKGEIEHIPLPDGSVEVIISNCVINLSVDKRQVLREAFRVLRPGGRFAVSDVVVRGELPSAVRSSMEAWVGCVAGALEEEEFKALLAAQGFEQISIEPTRIYHIDDARVMGAFVRAQKPLE